MILTYEEVSLQFRFSNSTPPFTSTDLYKFFAESPTFTLAETFIITLNFKVMKLLTYEPTGKVETYDMQTSPFVLSFTEVTAPLAVKKLASCTSESSSISSS